MILFSFLIKLEALFICCFIPRWNVPNGERNLWCALLQFEQGEIAILAFLKRFSVF